MRRIDFRTHVPRDALRPAPRKSPTLGALLFVAPMVAPTVLVLPGAAADR